MNIHKDVDVNTTLIRHCVLSGLLIRYRQRKKTVHDTASLVIPSMLSLLLFLLLAGKPRISVSKQGSWQFPSKTWTQNGERSTYLHPLINPSDFLSAYLSHERFLYPTLLRLPRFVAELENRACLPSWSSRSVTFCSTSSSCGDSSASGILGSPAGPR